MAASITSKHHVNGYTQTTSSTGSPQRLARSIPHAIFPLTLTLLMSQLIFWGAHVWHALPLPSNDLRLSQFVTHTADGYGGSNKRAGSSFQQRKQAPSNKTHIRYDDIADILSRSYGIVHQLPSIPLKRRMIPGTDGDYEVPPDAVHNLTYFLESRERKDEEDRPLYIYNPSLFALTEQIDTSIIEDVSYGILGKVAYIATYRVSNFGNCHGPGRGVPNTYQNYLGIALLGQDLNIINHSSGYSFDVVIDLNAVLFRGRRGIKQSMQDCQIYAVTAANDAHTTGGKANQLILQCNEYAMPVHLRALGAPERAFLTNNEGNENIAFRNTYGTGLHLIGLRKPTTIVSGGKNMHHFGPGYIETWPSGPHEFVHITFDSHPFAISHHLTSLQAEPSPSYSTGEHNNTLTQRDSGSACCVPVSWQDKNNNGSPRTVLLGFSHRKTNKFPKKDSYNYVSRVYAFETTPPFNIVARSGFFCLGFASPNIESSGIKEFDNEQVSGAARNYKLIIEKEEYDCPRIHFVTGITEKDENTAIVSYGVNDCYPMMIEVEKKFLVGLLMGRLLG